MLDSPRVFMFQIMRVGLCQMCPRNVSETLKPPPPPPKKKAVASGWRRKDTGGDFSDESAQPGSLSTFQYLPKQLSSPGPSRKKNI